MGEDPLSSPPCSLAGGDLSVKGAGGVSCLAAGFPPFRPMPSPSNREQRLQVGVGNLDAASLGGAGSGVQRHGDRLVKCHGPAGVVAKAIEIAGAGVVADGNTILLLMRCHKNKLDGRLHLRMISAPFSCLAMPNQQEQRRTCSVVLGGNCEGASDSADLVGPRQPAGFPANVDSPSHAQSRPNGKEPFCPMALGRNRDEADVCELDAGMAMAHKVFAIMPESELIQRAHSLLELQRNIMQR